MSLGVTEIVLILIVILVLFGGKKIPELARGLGKAQAEYKKAKEVLEEEVNEFKAEVEKVSAQEATKTKTSKKTTVKKPVTKKKTITKKTATTKKPAAVKKTAKK